MVIYKMPSTFDDLLDELPDKTNCTKILVETLNSLEMELTKDEENRIKNKIRVQFCRAMIEDNTQIGGQIVSKCLEPISQGILKSMHSAGKATKVNLLITLFKSKDTDPNEMNEVYAKVNPLIAYRYLVKIIKVHPSKLIEYYEDRFIYFNTVSLVKYSKLPFEYTDLLGLTNQTETYYDETRKCTITKVKCEKSKSEIHDKLIEYQTNDSIQYDSDSGKFIVTTDFAKLDKYIKENPDIFDTNFLVTYNIQKVIKYYDVITARILCEYLLYREYKYDPIQISVISSFLCSMNFSLSAKEYNKLGTLTSMYSSAISNSTKAALENKVSSDINKEFIASVVCNLENTYVGQMCKD